MIPELERHGVDAVPAVWSDSANDWSHFDLVVIRSCWDYHRRAAEFLDWVDKVPRLRNEAATVRWNAHKGYLLELERGGIRIPKTIVLKMEDRRSRLSGQAELPVLQARGRVIVKPAVSASAYETHLFDDIHDGASDLERLVAERDVVIQEFVPEVISRGEWSLHYFDREFSHAVLKTPKSGDFRVQQELGGFVQALTPPRALREMAEHALRLVSGDLLYARVDLVETDRGAVLMELELIEPSLYLKTNAEATTHFARAIGRRLPSKSRR